ncbi:dihydrofolate reductase [Arthrobacter sp. PvP102]|jgi:dihydrofolate reductase|uniref:dihydrofolate reductase n=1 Tax=unclassified Arthrobacter TaxID=235627 RepID=UPI00005273A3|nr:MULTISPECIES: dihydrofolate reductase [unclassified Arthrobacter]ABK04398.1 dihydrofolate reductase [Arthrobacter sp. FB24]MBP1232336.1 dihydrofolate reductase [Arthrobacter sp. PvP103]MBP1237471.1 dihydrofolate reductase [Arthrobacter sp. PvP102]
MSTDNAMDPLAFTEKIADGTTGVGLVWAQTTAGVIGKDGDMPWHLPEDMKHFTRLTTGHPVIMGRKTWLSFPDKYRPLPGRTNIVVTRQEGWGDTPDARGAIAVKSLDDALLESQFAPGHETVWVLGGGEIFAQTLDIADVAVVTFIDSETDGDTYAPELGYEWKLAASEPATGWLTSATGTRYRFTMWRRTEA